MAGPGRPGLARARHRRTPRRWAACTTGPGSTPTADLLPDDWFDDHWTVEERDRPSGTRILAAHRCPTAAAASRSSRPGRAVAWVVAGPSRGRASGVEPVRDHELWGMYVAATTTAAGWRQALAERALGDGRQSCGASTGNPRGGGVLPRNGWATTAPTGAPDGAPHRRGRLVATRRGSAGWCAVARVSRVQISPSILSADFANLERELDAISNADWAHVDVMDNHFVPEPHPGPAGRRGAGQGVADPDRLPPDDRRPRPVGPGYAEAGAKSVTFHVEAVQDAVGHRPRDPRGGRPGGLRGQAGHPVRALRRPAARGRHGARHDGRARASAASRSWPTRCPRCARCARRCAGTVARCGSRSTAGSRPSTIEQCAEAGADVFVAGSAVYGAESAAAAIDELRALAARHAHG